jgi:hypothetical protein
MTGQYPYVSRATFPLRGALGHSEVELYWHPLYWAIKFWVEAADIHSDIGIYAYKVKKTKKQILFTQA